ncbi:YicC/YloC family endoribonuclease [Lentilitoribacter sp. EG35]|uniref:YicC/YloC family endoribonuclease n=1 Tax=Lentilitoribacter sp. EG35 TaxID=3234192 RepID=UPI0034605085
MAVSSMTGFASADGIHDNASWLWEIRSVNGKGLDVRLRLPSGFEALESQVRAASAKALKRGNIQISLNVKEQHSAELVVNQAALEQVMNIASQLSENTNIEKASVDGILNVRGVLEERQVERSQSDKDKLIAEMSVSFLECLDALVVARQSEGANLTSVLLDQMEQVALKVGAIVADPSRTQDAIRIRLKEQVRNLLEVNSDFDEDRLHTEAAILATKADLQEELDRLVTHIKAAKSLIKEGGAVGRRLDFLAQEFNRECNTVCSKSNAGAVTTIGLDLKVIIDQFREQIQNVE